jgi:hypothetical protein
MSNSKPHHEDLPGDYHGPIVCKNCDHVFDGHFCNNCGQSAHTHAVDWHYIWHEIPHSIWHLDRGILYTARQLLTRPGYTIREYLDGKRVQHYRPLAFAFLFGAISAFLYFNISLKSFEDFSSGFQQGFKDGAKSSDQIAKQIQSDFNSLFKKYYVTLIVGLIPIRAWLMYLFFRRRGLNYPQHVVANTFMTGLESLVTVLFFPVSWLTDGTSAFWTISTVLSLVSSLVYPTLAYVQLFTKQGVRRWRLVVRSTIAVFFTFVISMTLLGISLLTYLGIKHGAKMAKQAKAVTVPAATPTQPRP